MATTPSVARHVGFSIFSVAVPKEADFPFIVYRRSGVTREAALGGPLFVPMVNIQIACWAREYDRARAMADDVRLLLDGHIGTLASATIQDIRLISEVDDFLDPTAYGAQLPPAYEVRQAYQVRWQEATA